MEHTWSARSVRPTIAAGVGAVFLGFMALARFVFHSDHAVTALLFAGLGTLAALVPSLLSRVEYRVTDTGLSRRRLGTKPPKEFEQLFTWDDLGHITPTRAGFRFRKKMRPSGGVDRFLKVHVLGGYSGEVHVEREDRSRVRAWIDQHSPGSGGREGLGREDSNLQSPG